MTQRSCRGSTESELRQRKDRKCTHPIPFHPSPCSVLAQCAAVSAIETVVHPLYLVVEQAASSGEPVELDRIHQDQRCEKALYRKKFCAGQVGKNKPRLLSSTG